MELIVTGKTLKPKHKEKGAYLVKHLNELAEQFKLRSLSLMDMEADLKVAFTQVKDYLGEHYNDYVNGKYEVPEEENEKFVPLRRMFMNISMKYHEAKRDNEKDYHEMVRTRKERDSFSNKIFKAYKLDPKQTYQFNFDSGDIMMVEQPKPEKKNHLVN